MKSPFECRRFAEKCRALANGLSPERRQEVLRMADISESLARDRQDMAKRQVLAKRQNLAKRKSRSQHWQEHRTA